jgi:tRNA-Thr(GGU) m(6)t(6)A37 methyltransferase TsaA
MHEDLLVHAIGVVRSPLRARESAPRQGDEGGVEAVLAIDPRFRDGLRGISTGDELIVLTWLHDTSRDVLEVHPRGDPARPLTGVFATRSPDRPNPIGLHRVSVVALEDCDVTVRPLEAIDGTPVVDLKPVLGNVRDR